LPEPGAFKRAASRTIVILACVVLPATCSFASGQAPAPTPAPAPAPTPVQGPPPFEGPNQPNVSLYLDLHDKKGHALTDLKESELSVTDAGHPVDSRELRITRDTQSGDHLITFLFDRLNPAGARNAARAARNILKGIGDGPGEIAVWAISNRLRVVQPYTADRSLVEAAIDEANSGPALIDATADKAEKQLVASETLDVPDASSSRQRLWDRATIETMNGAGRAVSEQRTSWSIGTFSALAYAQRPLKGRKAIVFFTQIVPSDINAADQLRAASHGLRDASISVYTVDLNSLDVDEQNGMVTAAAMGQTTSAIKSQLAAQSSLTRATQPLGLNPTEFKAMTDTIVDVQFNGLTNSRNLLDQLTTVTGGVYTNSDADNRKIGRHIMESLNNYYTLSYPEREEVDGRFHPVVVKVLRPGLKADTTSGYFAVRPGNSAMREATASLDAGDAVAGEELASLDSLTAGATPADLTVEAALLRFGKASKGVHSVVAVEVPIRQLDLHEDANTALYSLHATLGVEIQNASGDTVARFHEEFRRHGSTQLASEVRTRCLSLQRSLNLPAGDYRVQAVVRDWNTDKVGKSAQTVHLAEAEGVAALSDLVLVRSTDEGGDAPLPYGTSHIVPNLSGQVGGESAAASLYFQVYPQPGKVPEQLRLEVSKDGKKLASLPMQTETMHANEGSARVAQVTLGSSPGVYDLTLYLERDGQIVTRHLSVTNAVDETKSAKFGPPSIDVDLHPADAQLTPQQSADLLADARTRALAYTESLPNFICVESIDRSVDVRGTGDWKPRDSIVEMLRYVDKSENRAILEVDGQKSNLPLEKLQGAYSNGEFGGVLQMIFDPVAAADFAWQKTEEKDGQTLQVYSYKVDAKNSQFMLTAPDRTQIPAPFHGEVLIDNDTHSVRRLLVETGELPPDFGIKASWISVEYDYIGINGHEYLLPARGEVGLKQGRNQAVSNHLRFGNYRRYGSQIKLLSNEADGNSVQ